MSIEKFSYWKNDERVFVYPHVNVKEVESFGSEFVCCYTYLRIKGEDGNWYLSLLFDSVFEPSKSGVVYLLFQRFVKNIEKKKLFCPMDKKYRDIVSADEMSNIVTIPNILIDDVNGDISEEERVKNIMQKPKNQ